MDIDHFDQMSYPQTEGGSAHLDDGGVDGPARGLRLLRRLRRRHRPVHDTGCKPKICGADNMIATQQS